MKYLLTGATGFVGESLVKSLTKTSNSLVSIGRRPSENIDFYSVDFESHFNVQEALNNVDVVLHCAARAHVMNDLEADPLSLYQKINSEATLRLAKQAAKAGVKRFVFLSTIKVNGDITILNKPFNESISIAPVDYYAVSKYEAELGLIAISKKVDMEIVIIRSPLVYGPRVKGNFSSVVNLVKKNILLPLGSIVTNKRSLIGIENLVNFILFCADYKKTPQAANETFLISDGEDVSTAELFKRVAKACGKKNRLFSFPVSLLRLGARLLSKQDMADRLLGSLQVDSSKARELLGWKPVLTMQEQLKKMAEADELAKKNN